MKESRLYLKKASLLFVFFVRVIARMLLPKKTGVIISGSVKNILVYGQMGVGNMVLFTPFLFSIRNHYKKSVITLLLYSDNGCSEVLKGSNLIDELMFFNVNNRSWFDRMVFLFEIRSRKFDLVISRFNNSYFSALLTTFSGAQTRLGHVSGGGWVGKYDFLYNYPVEIVEKKHEVNLYLDLAHKVGATVEFKSPILSLSEWDLQVADHILENVGLKKDDTYIVIQLGSNRSQAWKRWPADYWLELTHRLLKKGISIVALGSPDERQLIESCFSDLPLKPAVVAGQATLMQSAAIIKRAKLLVCNDSGLMHIAAAVNTITIAIFGPTDFDRTRPVGDKHVVLRAKLPCMPCYTYGDTTKVNNCLIQYRCLRLITVEEVFNEIVALV